MVRIAKELEKYYKQIDPVAASFLHAMSDKRVDDGNKPKTRLSQGAALIYTRIDYLLLPTFTLSEPSSLKERISKLFQRKETQEDL